jgi:hypothetical protein
MKRCLSFVIRKVQIKATIQLNKVAKLKRLTITGIGKEMGIETLVSC